jgi:thiamine-monophosphate kinase
MRNAATMSDESAEDRLIARHFGPLAQHPGAFGLMDDAAVLVPPAGCDLVLKADAVVGGVHFFADDPPESIARKALRVNLSDLAAKGAKPLGFLLSLALPNGIGDDWLAAFAGGLAADAEQYECPLLGGDTDRTPGPVTVSIATFGALPHGSMIRRTGARVGDRIVVTGTIGDASLGLLLRKEGPALGRWHLDEAMRAHLLDRYLLPRPRNAIADVVRQHASAAMDVSDGLAGDLAKLCRVSGVSAVIDVPRMPLSAAARAALGRDASLVEPILTGGDDYEILATVAVEKFEAFRASAAAFDVDLTDIGKITSGDDAPRFVGGDGRPLKFARPSFSHF